MHSVLRVTISSERHCDPESKAATAAGDGDDGGTNGFSGVAGGRGGWYLFVWTWDVTLSASYHHRDEEAQ